MRSFFLDDLEAALGARLPVERANVPTAIARVGDAVTPTELATAVANDIWQYLPRTSESGDRRTTAFRTLEALARRDADLAAIRHGRRVSQRPMLGDVLPPDAPHLTLTLSASQLKSVAHCTYAHFVQKVLSPVELAPPEYNALTKGSLIHDAIMHWSTALDGWVRGDPALGELQSWAREQIAAWSPAMRGADRSAWAMDGDLARLHEFLEHELSFLTRADVAQPSYAELAFGEEMDERGPRDAASRTEPFELVVPTSKGETSVRFRGSMDRVDVITIGGRRYGVIIDYKNGKSSKFYAKEMLSGNDLQLRLYLLVLERFWGITPVGALYLGLGDGVRRGAVRGEFAGHIAGLDAGAEALELMAPDEWSAFVGQTPELIARLADRLVRLDVTPAPRDHKCGFCTLTPLCRYERWASEEPHV